LPRIICIRLSARPAPSFPAPTLADLLDANTVCGILASHALALAVLPRLDGGADVGRLTPAPPALPYAQVFQPASLFLHRGAQHLKIRHRLLAAQPTRRGGMAALHTCRRRNSTVVLQTSRTNLPASYISGDLLAPNYLHLLIGKARTSTSRAARHWRPPPPGKGGGGFARAGGRGGRPGPLSAARPRSSQIRYSQISVIN